MISKLFWSAAFFAFVVSGCSAQKAQNLETRDLSLEGGDRSVSVKAQIARTAEERGLGLMYRTKLADGEAMLFVFDRDEVLSFWMKNTLIPLSIAFILSDGRIVEIKNMEPGSLEPVRSSRSVRYALEVPQGWFDRTGVKTGDRLTIDRL